ncbi:MAG: gluconate 2-dehydrogenase subunit 3 family protein [Opitutaceae bacterium]|nr:gluconate 2-dehydrogenase subunit 3 family protein [Opitutaceae bacterium]
MNSSDVSSRGRRAFFRTAVLAAGAATLNPTPSQGAPGDATPAPAAPVGYLCFSPDEAAFVEALVEVMCPADDLTPGGIDCGLAYFMDRQLAGPFGKGDRLYRRGPWRPGRPEDGYQLPLTPEQFFKAGIKAANQACLAAHRRQFPELTAEEADRMLQAFSTGDLKAPVFGFSEWFNDLVYPLFTQACFADPIYGGNRGKVFWSLIGYPGLPAVNGLNMVKYRGKPYPGAHPPKSIEDFS